MSLCVGLIAVGIYDKREREVGLMMLKPTKK